MKDVEESAAVSETLLSLRSSLQEAIVVIQRHGGRLTAHELQAEMGIGLSTAYTYLKELLAQDVVERLKIQSAKGTSKQFLYIIKPTVCELNGHRPQDSELLDGTDIDQESLKDRSDDPVEDMLEILSYLTQKMKILEQKFTNLEQEKLKHYTLISALKQEIEGCDSRET